MVSPYAARLRMKALDASGRTVGNLYAISTVGSITGTFLAGFFLIPRFGSTTILFILAGLLVVASILLAPRGRLAIRAPAIVLVGLFGAVPGQTKSLQIETQYNSVMIGEAPHAETGRTIRIMALNSQDSSAMFVDSDELVHAYTKFYHLASHFCPGLKTALMIGGAAYSYPRDYVTRYPQASIDVVEIDPKVTELARQYFRLEDHPRLHIEHEDGRIFLNETRKKYDVFFGDAFQSRFSVPFHLTTKEAAQRVHDLLEEGGVAILNTICSVEGKEGKFLRAIYATWSEVFPQVYLFPVEDAADGSLVQNVMVVALKSRATPSFQSEDPELNRYLSHRWTGEVARDVAVLTDDHAPVEYYLGAASVAK
jgi:spermidine synthase